MRRRQSVTAKPLSEDPLVRQSLAQLATEVNILRLFNYRVGWMVEKGLESRLDSG